MEQALVDRLLATAGLSVLVGTRIDWLKRPQGSTLPAIVLQVVSAPYEYTMKHRTRLVGRLVQCDVWAANYSSMKAVSRALIAACDGPHTAPIQGIFVEGERETREGQDGPDSRGSTDFFRSSIDLRVWSDDAA